MEKQREEQKHRKGAEDRRETDTKKKMEKRGRSAPLPQTYTSRIIAIMTEGKKGGPTKPGDGDVKAEMEGDSSRERERQGVGWETSRKHLVLASCLPGFVTLWSSKS